MVLQVSIQLIAPASGALFRVSLLRYGESHKGFHSTDCPSEWGLMAEVQDILRNLDVSIQLIAPASGALMRSYP